MVQGELGDAFYAVGSGRLDVIEDDRTVRQVTAGDHFGELALLHDIPRVATVRAAVPSRVFRVDRDRFDDLVRHGFQTGVLRPNLALDRR